MIIRIRSRDGLERVTISDPATATVQTLKSQIQSQLRVPIDSQTLSLNQNLLLSKTPAQTLAFTDLADPAAPLSSLNIAHGSIIYLAYEGERSVARPVIVNPAGSFGRKMTMDDLIAKQMRVSRQETGKCEQASFDRDAANCFQMYVNQTLAFAVKRGGFMYGKVGEGGAVEVDFIYEPPQQVVLLSCLGRSGITDPADPAAPLSSLNIAHGSIIYLAYEGERSVARPIIVNPAGSFGRKMTMDDLIAKQMRVSRQETGKCEQASFDRDAANCFQMYVNQTLAFAVKRGGFMYGKVGEGGAVEVDFIYEPPQQGTEDSLILLRDPAEEALVEAIALGLGMRRVGFVFSQAVGRKGEYTLSAREVIQAAELHAEGGIEEWVTALVKLEVNEDGAADVHFEAFQMSDICVKLFKEGWFVTEVGDDDDPKVSRMKKDVVVGVKDTKEVDNDFFLVPVKITDHQGPLSSTFPVENRITTVTIRALKDHLSRSKHLPFVKRISDFHLLLLLARYLDVNADVPALAACVCGQTAVPEGYQLLIESLAAAA